MSPYITEEILRLQHACLYQKSGPDILTEKKRNTIIAGSEHCEHARVSAGLVPLTLKLQFLIRNQ